MVRHLFGKLILIASAAIVTGHQQASGQVAGRHEEVIDNASCAVGNCTTNFLTYGYFRENWRRWPEETGPASAALNPFVVPDRDSPRPMIPSPRDEASQFFRRRTPIQATPDDARTDVSPRTTAPRSDGGGTFPELENLPSNGSEMPPSGGDLTEPIPTIPDTQEDDENIFGPTDSEDLPGSSLPEESEDLFDLDSLDLGQQKPRTDRVAAVPGSTSTPPSLQTVSVQAREPRRLTQVAARELGQVHHQGTVIDRRNPLRRNVSRDDRRFQATPDDVSTEPAVAGSRVVTATHVEAVPTSLVRGRSNPLRSR